MSAIRLKTVAFCIIIQSNLVNSKSSVQETLFLIISSSSYREVDIKMYFL